MTIGEIITEIERLAPLGNQEEWDNSGLQVGTAARELSSAIVCLDVTEEVVDEAIASGANLILSHHPLIFRALTSVSDATWQQRCVVKAILNGITIYSAHTSLDNSIGGVNHRIASLLGLKNLKWLDSGTPDEESGSGLIGELDEAMSPETFLMMVKEKFGVSALKHSAPVSDMIRTVALCGGAGAFLLPQAVAAGADCFMSGEFHYHDYFSPGTMLVETGHYESEQYTQDLLQEYLLEHFPGIDVRRTTVMTNPAYWLK